MVNAHDIAVVSSDSGNSLQHPGNIIHREIDPQLVPQGGLLPDQRVRVSDTMTYEIPNRFSWLVTLSMRRGLLLLLWPPLLPVPKGLVVRKGHQSIWNADSSSNATTLAAVEFLLRVGGGNAVHEASDDRMFRETVAAAAVTTAGSTVAPWARGRRGRAERAREESLNPWGLCDVRLFDRQQCEQATSNSSTGFTIRH